MAKIDTLFMTKTAENHTFWGRAYHWEAQYLWYETAGQIILRSRKQEKTSTLWKNEYFAEKMLVIDLLPRKVLTKFSTHMFQTCQMRVENTFYLNW